MRRPSQMPSGMGQCGMFAISASGGANPGDGMGIFCSFADSSAKFFKSFLMYGAAPATIAAQTVPTVEAVFKSYKLAPGWTQKILSPYAPARLDRSRTGRLRISQPRKCEHKPGAGPQAAITRGPADQDIPAQRMQTQTLDQGQAAITQGRAAQDIPAQRMQTQTLDQAQAAITRGQVPGATIQDLEVQGIPAPQVRAQAMDQAPAAAITQGRAVQDIPAPQVRAQAMDQAPVAAITRGRAAQQVTRTTRPVRIQIQPMDRALAAATIRGPVARQDTHMTGRTRANRTPTCSGAISKLSIRALSASTPTSSATVRPRRLRSSAVDGSRTSRTGSLRIDL